MRRVQTQVGAQVYEWYDSAQAQHSMTALAKLCASLFGQNGMINGLAVTQTTVASMSVLVGIGEVYQVAPLESSVCGTLPQDISHTILKQGLRLDSGSISGFSAPTTSGQSINYLIEVQYQDYDLSLDPTSGTSPVVLQFYNASNPTTPWSGPNNSGASSNTFRDGIVAIQVKAGVVATTGSQTTPSPDSGWLPLAVVTVAYGQSTITNANISTYPGAPFLPSGGLVVGGLQGNACNISSAGGTADAITGSYTPGITALTNGMTLYVRASSANATTTPTFTPNSGTIAAKTIVKGAGAALAAGDIAGVGHWVELQYDSILDKWVQLNPATGVQQQNQYQYQYQSLTASVASNALTVIYGGGFLDFRSGTQSNGAPTRAVQVSSNGITIPSGATLGTVSGQSARLVFLEAYNGGSPVLCVVNQAGGVQLDETNLISPTTISSGATSAGVIYSASSVSANSPYRIVGAFDIVETTAGTWATAPSNAINAGSIALNSIGGLGYSQTWQNFTESKSSGTTYYNTTGRPIFALVMGNNSSCLTYVNGVAIQPNSNEQNTSSFIVPAGGNYSVKTSLLSWWELR